MAEGKAKKRHCVSIRTPWLMGGLSATRTVELVLVSSPACQRNALRLLTGQENLQEQTKDIIPQGPESDLGVKEPSDSLLWPSDFALQLFQGQGRRV